MGSMCRVIDVQLTEGKSAGERSASHTAPFRMRAASSLNAILALTDTEL